MRRALRTFYGAASTPRRLVPGLLSKQSDEQQKVMQSVAPLDEHHDHCGEQYRIKQCVAAARQRASGGDERAAITSAITWLPRSVYQCTERQIGACRNTHSQLRIIPLF